MGTKLHGVTVKLFEKVQTGTDAFGAPIYTETAVEVENVLIGQPGTQQATEVQDTLSLYGKKIVYMLGIPKGDTHDWKEKKVELPAPFSGVFKTVSFETTGIQDMIPLGWGRNIAVERFDG